jgi:hypothetical protein
MIRISQVSWPNMGLDYGWMFEIREQDELDKWFEDVLTPMAKQELAEALRFTQGKAHANVVASMAGLRGISMIDAQTSLNSARRDGMHGALAKSGRIFINKVGGYFINHPGLCVKNGREISAWILPGDEVRILQWSGGTHFYAKIGQQDIEWEGKCKWDTRAEAEHAARCFVREGEERDGTSGNS